MNALSEWNDLIEFGREKSHWSRVPKEERAGAFGRGEMISFALFTSIVKDLARLFDDDAVREYRYSYSLGAVLTDHSTFAFRLENYEQLLATVVRIHSKG